MGKERRKEREKKVRYKEKRCQNKLSGIQLVGSHYRISDTEGREAKGKKSSLAFLCNTRHNYEKVSSAAKKKNLATVGFEPTPPKRLVP